ncbi:putative phage tail protein [Azospirillum sp. SYSU D00513]|uniref:YmfQ family protein n=1 Tax=Azospirillum sp. SYSU D00513 TaxID=2812561 RepID=UPI001A975EA9|nr:putative phage tail protein [Azospirillum sp. SYSU D00513]
MQATADDYYGLLLGLRPVGPAWPEDDDLLRAVADGLARVHARSLRLIEEADPRTAAELLPEWEAFAGLPDDCTAGVDLTLDERRAALVARLTARGGQSRAYFQGLAAAVGYPGAEIVEFRPFTVGSSCADAINPDPWRHAWRVHVPDDGGLTVFDAGSACTAGLRAWGRPLLECAIRRVQPAHGHVLFGYGAEEVPPPPQSVVRWDGGATVWDDGNTVWEI